MTTQDGGKVQLSLAGQMREVAAKSIGTRRSRSTGRDLEQLELEFRAGEQLWERLDDELREARSEEHAGIPSADGRQWRVGTWSTSYSSGGAARTYTVELSEVEPAVTPERIEFLGQAFVPEYYEEHLPETGTAHYLVEVTANAAQSEALTRLLTDNSNSEGDVYFDLTRHGVAGPAQSVRFGRALWQAGQDGGRRYQLVFVLQDQDESSALRLGEPEGGNTRRMAIRARDGLAALLAELARAGVLDEEALTRIEEVQESAHTRGRLDFWETRDLADFR